MKRFLYYNQDSVNSLLAQIEQGLQLKNESGNEEANSATSTTGIKGTITGDLGAKVLGIGATLKGEIEASDNDSEVTTKIIRSVQEKVLHGAICILMKLILQIRQRQE